MNCFRTILKNKVNGILNIYYWNSRSFSLFMDPLNCPTVESKEKEQWTKPLQFLVIAECSVSKARTSLMKLPHYEVELPMFMPVGTQGTMKGLTPKQVEEAGAQIILGNTYHLGTRPGKALFEEYNGLHEFMQWERALLTDSGGFQMVSLTKLAEVTENGVKFQSPFDSSECMLTPEESIGIQNAIGADIIMQLDDVVDVRDTEYRRFEIAVDRTTRWLDRCIKANTNPETQSLFPIIQGGLFPDLRKRSLQQLTERDASGYAIGGLSGGEDKSKFWPTVDLCTNHLPKHKPRYCMGVGFPVDIVVCCALGVDMFDCVYPTRTARFGFALVDGEQISMKNIDYKFDFSPIDKNCDCLTCKHYTKAYIHSIVTKEAVGCHLISTHNIAYMMRLMRDIRESIKKGKFVEFVRNFMNICYKGKDYPQWVVDALKSVNISLQDNESETTDIWDEMEDETSYMERMSGFQSSCFNMGYRETVLKDYEKEAEKGRVLGYESAVKYSSPCDNAASSASATDTRGVILNPTYTLSRWLGALLACQAVKEKRKDIEEKDLFQLKELVSKIEQLITKVYTPSDAFTTMVLRSSDPETSNFSDEAATLHSESESAARYIEECSQLCKKLKWNVNFDDRAEPTQTSTVTASP